MNQSALSKCGSEGERALGRREWSGPQCVNRWSWQPGPGASREKGQSRPEAWAHSAYSLQSKGGHPAEGRPAWEGPKGDVPEGDVGRGRAGGGGAGAGRGF